MSNENISSKQARWVITGGAGFVGSHLVWELVHQKQQVTVVDDLSNSTLQNLEDVWPDICFVKADVRKQSSFLPAFEKADYVIHLAALVSVPLSLEQPDTTMEINVQGTENVLEAAYNTGVKKVIFASSSAVYGNAKNMPLAENTALDFQSPYALSKYLGEKLCRHYTEVFGLHTAIVRAFNIYGPGACANSSYASVVAQFMQAAKDEKPIYINGDGTQVRDFIYVQDVAKAYLLIAEKGRAGEAYNVAGGQGCTLLELANVIERVSGKSLQRRFNPPRPGDILYSVADTSKLQALGFAAKISLEEGLRQMWKKH